jgi:hypothetical protein
MDEILACNCIFQPAVMPTNGWDGLTADDNYQALAIASVMKNFTDQGVEVWLRFGVSIFPLGPCPSMRELTFFPRSSRDQVRLARFLLFFTLPLASSFSS